MTDIGNLVNMLDPGLLLTVGVGIFSAGVTWGIMSAKQRALTQLIDKTVTALNNRMDKTVTELSAAAADLRNLSGDVKAMAMLSARVEAVQSNHDEKISRLEIEVAKLTVSLNR